MAHGKFEFKGTGLAALWLFIWTVVLITRKHSRVFSIFFVALTLGQAAYGSSAQFVTLGKGVYSGISERALIVIRSEEDWDMLWTRHVSKIAPKPDMPSIDFSKDMVIAVFTGLKPSGGYKVEIVKMEMDEKTMTVFYRETRPSPQDIVATVMTQPYHLTKIERQNFEIDFEEIKQGEGHD